MERLFVAFVCLLPVALAAATVVGPGAVGEPASRDEALAALGETLFFDPGLSGTGTQSCATCHDPAHAFADPRPGPPAGRSPRAPTASPTATATRRC